MTASDGQGGDKHAGSQKDGAGAQGTAAEAPALAIIDAFGGIRPMAKQLGLAVSTVQGWKERGAIPVNRHDPVDNGHKALCPLSRPYDQDRKRRRR